MIDLSIWSFPLSVLLVAVFALLPFLLGQFRSLSKVKTLLGGNTAACILLLLLAVLLAVEGTWKLELYHSWLFFLVVIIFSLSLGLITLKNLKIKWFSAAFLSHGGMFILLLAGLFGAADGTDSQLVVTREKPEHLSYTFTNKIVPLPFDVQLKDFRIDYYEDGRSPKQYTSTLLINGEQRETSVNHPCHYKGYDIYQSDYDAYGQQYSVLKVVKDPWLYGVYASMLLMILGSLIEVRKTWNNKAVLPLVLVLTVLFSFLSVARINFGTLMPALRSLWFLPHLIVYMIAYSLMAIASVWSLLSFFRQKFHSEMPYKLLVTSSALLLIGMLCGAVWAKAAWGQYWTWDAKECWAAVTWMLTLVGIHLPAARRVKLSVLVIWLAFLAMQITWYGVNYLPSAIYSLHIYNN